MSGAVEAEALGKRFGHTWALRDCFLRLPAGSIAGLVGPNGAGKTTLLHLAAGLLRPDAGDIRIFGRSPRDQPRLLLDRVGFMAQDAPLYPGFSVRDMLHLGRSLNARWDQAGAEQRLRRLGIPLDKRIGQLSGGQRAQVALAVALGKRPDLLLLDEPVARLDPLARRELLQELTQTATDDGPTVVLSSHLIGDLERVCDYLIILSSGRVQVAGGIDDLLAVHHRLCGPREEAQSVLNGLALVAATHAERQSSLLVRGDVDHLALGWHAEPIGLEELVIAYLSQPLAMQLPAPELMGAAT